MSGTDADDFTIENGVLKFKSPPDFEIQLDATTAAAPNTPTTGTTGSDGTYEVRVRFSDGGNAATHLLRVEVQDVEEPGMVMLSPLQPQVGTPLQAVIMDLDGLTTDTSGNPSATYRWAKSASMGGMSTDIAGATGRTYTPVEVDEGSYLQVTVVYLEHASTRPAKTEVGKATLPVRPDTHMNEAPVVPLTGQGHSGTGLQDNPIIRYVSENMPAGTKVGPRVTGVDDNLDVLTYAFGGTSAQMTAAEPFDIDPATGQITTNRVLDFAEGTAADANDTRAVVVTATDPDGEVLNIRVDIRVTDVNEPGVFPFITDPDGSTTAANRERSIVEGTPEVPLTGDALIIGTYTAPDQDDSNAKITWTTGGIDGDPGLFVLDASSSPNAVLSFRESPDYEDPKDMNRDNLYELTVIATDSNGLESTLAVTVRVINDPADDTNMAGELEIFNRQPEVNTVLEVTGNPEDDDGGVRGRQMAVVLSVR